MMYKVIRWLEFFITTIISISSTQFNLEFFYFFLLRRQSWSHGSWITTICAISTLVSSTNKTECHDITEILLKVALTNINHLYKVIRWLEFFITTIISISSTQFNLEFFYFLMKIVTLEKSDTIMNCETFTGT
jgi:hypothetical protein